MADTGTHTWWCGAINHPDHGLLLCHPPRPVVTASRTDRQPPNPVAGAKGGYTPVGPGTTKHPDPVTAHEGTNEHG